MRDAMTPRPRPSVGPVVWAWRVLLALPSLALVVAAGWPRWFVMTPEGLSRNGFLVMAAGWLVAAEVPLLAAPAAHVARSVVGDGDLWAPTVLGWRHVRLAHASALVVVEANGFQQVTERWVLRDGWTLLVVADPASHRSVALGLAGMSPRRTLREHLRSRLRGRVRGLGQRWLVLRAGALVVAHLLWSTVVGSVLALVVLRLAGRA